MRARIKPAPQKTGAGRKRFLRGMFIGLFLTGGICLLLYPWISNAINDRNSAASSASYQAAAEEAEDGLIEEMLAAAEEYNTKVQHSQVELTDPFDPTALTAEDMDTASGYENALNLNGDGVMCYIDIPAIGVYLPVYHGTSDSTLQKGIGHLSGSSLPIGGDSSHAVLTGHSGLTSAKMFTDISELAEGDLFYIHVLDQTLAYEVVEIQTVLPDDTEPLLIQDGRDLITLVTCTPYGVNTHRLFVTGERTEYAVTAYKEEGKKAAKNTMDSEWMRSYRRGLITGLIIIAAIFTAAVIIRKTQKRQ